LKKFKIIFFISLCIYFLVYGYSYSDSRYYKKLLYTERLTTPGAIFNYVSEHYLHNGCKIVHLNATPRHLITNHKRLWCDEGAIVIATLCYYAGYETRLVRMINIKNIDNHTFLQVREDNIWKNYDFTFQTIDAPIDSITKRAGIKLRDLQHYEYPRIYNKLINTNYFLKQAALYTRGINEDDFVE
jgi:hypothetical protein